MRKFEGFEEEFQRAVKSLAKLADNGFRFEVEVNGGSEPQITLSFPDHSSFEEEES